MKGEKAGKEKDEKGRGGERKLMRKGERKKVKKRKKIRKEGMIKRNG